MVLADLARGEIIQIDITAEVIDISQPYGDVLGGQVNVGDILTGSYIYDSTTPDTNPLNEEIGIYHHTTSPYGISVEVGGLIFQTDPCSVAFNIIITDNWPAGTDMYQIYSTNNLPFTDDIFIDDIYWLLSDSSGTAVSSDELPVTPPVLEDWSSHILGVSASMWIEDFPGHLKLVDAFHIGATVTLAVPEPATVLLFGLGGLILTRYRYH